MVWPYLNITESVRNYMKRQKDLQQDTSTEGLSWVQQDIWNNATAEFLLEQCGSVPQSTDGCLKGEDGHTKYWFHLELSSVHSLCIL